MFGRSQVEKGTKLCRFDGCGESDSPPPPQQSDTNTQALLEELMEEGSHSSSSSTSTIVPATKFAYPSAHAFAVEHSGGLAAQVR